MANGLESFFKQEGNPLAGRQVSNNSGGAFYRVSPVYGMLRLQLFPRLR
jgi:hypothetical protein